MSRKLSVVLTTTFTLLDQFQDAVSTTSQQNPASNEAKDYQDVLPLLVASSTALKSQATKLSLLCITSPFTPSAICTVLSALNESVLPSLVTAALLVTPNEFTKAFHAEIQILLKTTLKELASLVGEVKAVADQKEAQKKEEELSEPEKGVVTVATGRVWDSCDVLIDIANKGVVGFVIRRVEEFRDLVRDAVEEIEEWDPDEDGDELFDDLLGGDGKNGSDDGNEDEDEDKDEDGNNDDDEDTAASHARKKSTLRILKPVSQVFPAIVANRLKKAGDVSLSSGGGARKLETLMAHLQSVPENIDEVAGALYEANWEKHTQLTRKVKDEAAKAVELMASPWVAVDGQAAEDKFTAWAKTWLKVVNEVSKSIEDDATKSR